MKTIIVLILIIIYLLLGLLKTSKTNLIYASIGKKHTSTSKVLIATCVRDCESKIKFLKRNCQYFKRHFGQVKFLVMENNSTDNTRKKLLNLRKKMDMDILGCGVNMPACELKVNNIRTGVKPNRVRRMAYIRNILLDHIKQIQQDYDYCILIDGDINCKIHDNGFYESMYYLQKYKDIDAIACFGIEDNCIFRNFYDGYAYDKSNGSTYLDNMIDQYTSFYMKNLVKVKSAFNGITIYKLPFDEKIKYSEHTLACEHISFNKHLNMYMNRNFVVDILEH
jgi:hypothetical protein